MLKRVAAAGCLVALLFQPAVSGPALLFDAATDQVLYAEDIDVQWYPASLTKIMTAYLTFEALKAGKITLEQKIPVSELAHSQPPSKVGLPVGGELTVDLALRALIIKSANDAAVMLAEAIAGSEPAFVERMNETARRLGMTRTRFVNPNGLPAPEQVSTARDLAKLSRTVVKDFPEYNEMWAMADMRIGRIKLRSHNGMLRTFEGADGLKTGFICDSGFNIVAAATRDGRKLMAVVLGEPSSLERNVRAASLLEHGFQNYDWKDFFFGRKLDGIPLAAAEPAISMRLAVVGWECGRRGRARALAKAQKQRRAARAARARAPATPAEGGQPPAPAPAAVAPPKAPRPTPKAGTPPVKTGTVQ